MLKDAQLKDLQAKYVFCLIEDLFGKSPEQAIQNSASLFVPQYTVGWTNMDIEGAPSDAVIPFYFLSDKNICIVNVKLENLVLIKKL